MSAYVQISEQTFDALRDGLYAMDEGGSSYNLKGAEDIWLYWDRTNKAHYIVVP